MPAGSGYRRQLYRDDAVVLRAQKLGESDRIITLLTRRHGRLRAVARGVRRTGSKFGARLEPFGHIDLQLAGSPEGVGSSLHSISQVEGVNLFGKRFLEDYPRYTTASAIAETAERLSPVEREPSLRLFQLTLGALKALAVGEHATSLVLDAYLLRGMAFAGWAPAITECAVCGEKGPHGAFSVPAGGSVCPDCRPPGAAHPSPLTLALMAALLGGDWPYADTAEPAVRRECSGLVAAHLQWHMERNLRALPLVDRREPVEAPAGPRPLTPHIRFPLPPAASPPPALSPVASPAALPPALPPVALPPALSPVASPDLSPPVLPDTPHARQEPSQ